MPLQRGLEKVQAVRIEFHGQTLYLLQGRLLLLRADAAGVLQPVRSPEQLAFL